MDESDVGLIRFLMRDRHGTPFEHNSFRFHIRCPIFVAREWFRHRVGSFNEFCMRYAKATDDFYVPEAEDVRTQVGKPGAYSFEPVDPELAERTREELQAVYERRTRPTRASSRHGVARELARSVLPVGAYTEFYWTVNARALMNFVSLRAAETAQREIRRYAEAVETFLAEHMPVTHEAFVANGRERALRVEAVTGIGGVFLRANDPVALRSVVRREPRYRRSRRTARRTRTLTAAAGDMTVWATFPRDTDYFGRREQQAMVELPRPRPRRDARSAPRRGRRRRRPGRGAALRPLRLGDESRRATASSSGSRL